MNTIEIIEKITGSAFVNEYLPIEMQLGIPYPQLINDKLCLVFLPHKEKHCDKQTEIFRCAFKLVYAYPFHHIIEFQNLAFFGRTVSNESVCISDNHMLNMTVYGMENLYKEYDKLYLQMENKGVVSEVMVEKCQNAFREFLEENGLSEIYRL